MEVLPDPPQTPPDVRSARSPGERDEKWRQPGAGQIGDPTVPIEDRMAALDVLGEIMSRYKTGKPAKKQAEPAKPAGAASVDDLMKLLGKQ